MKKKLPLIIVICCIAAQLNAQQDAGVANWKPWIIKNVKEFRISQPVAPSKDELKEIIHHQQHLDSAAWAQIYFWNAGAPGYRWQEMINKLWMNDTAVTGALSNLLLGTAIYDATLAAWDTKYAYSRPRPYTVDGRIQALIPKPTSPSFPCEYSVAAGVAATVIGHFYPHLKDSLNKMADQLMRSRINAGVAFAGDTRAGFELGKKIALIQINETKGFLPPAAWDGKMPTAAGLWKGKPMFPQAGQQKTFVLESASQFRPGPPPDFAKDMAELKSFKPTFRSMSNAFFYASQPFWEDLLVKKMFEYNLHQDPPQAARLYATIAVATYDGFIACFDAKYAYWGTRPDQFDTTYKPAIIHTPPFPGYPSGHAMMSGAYSELFAYFFPAERNYFMKKAKDAAESRFQAGIHFRTDNEAGLELGRKVAGAVINKLKTDGARDAVKTARPAKESTQKIARL